MSVAFLFFSHVYSLCTEPVDSNGCLPVQISATEISVAFLFPSRGAG